MFTNELWDSQSYGNAKEKDFLSIVWILCKQHNMIFVKCVVAHDIACK